MTEGVYPHNYEELLGFTSIRSELEHLCQNEVGQALVERMCYMPGGERLEVHLQQLKEMMHLAGLGLEIPSFAFPPLREALLSIRPEGAYLSVESANALRQMLNSTKATSDFFRENIGEEEGAEVPKLKELAERLNDLPYLRRKLHNLIDEEGEVKDTASRTLREIRQELRRLKNSLSSTMQSVLRQAQVAGYVASDATPAMRDGRLLLPITPSAKKRDSRHCTRTIQHRANALPRANATH